MPDPHVDIPVRAPAATSADDTHPAVRGRRARPARPRRAARPGGRHDPDARTIIRRRSPSCSARRSCSRCCSARRSSSRAASSCRPRATDRCACWWSTSPRPARCAPAPASMPSASRPPMAAGTADPGALLGRGHLAMTIDQGPDMSRYQGLVALEGKDLEHAAHEYFLRSEQIPTRVRLAVGEELSARAGGTRHRWRAGGILLQFLPKSPERARQPDLDPGDAPEGTAPHTRPRGRCLGRRPLADRHGRGRRADRSRRCRPSGCSTACSTSAACGCSARSTLNARVLVLAPRRRQHAAGASRRTTATTWSRTA